MPSRILVAILIVTVAGLAAAAPGPTTVRTFTVRHCSVTEAVAAVEPLLTEDGSLTVQPARSRITVQDRADVVARAAEVIAALDRSPDRYRIEVVLLEGVSGQLPAGQRADVDPRLLRMFPFDSYRRIGATTFEGLLGEPADADLGEGHRVAFLAQSLGIGDDSPYGIPRPGSRAHLQWLTLTRQIAAANGSLQSAELLRTSVFLSEDQEIVIGAGAAEDSSRGLVMILRAHSIGSD
jgi:hypothetical protein